MSDSLVEFYKRHGISPVRQDISNLDRHFARRAALYRQLGLLPAFFQGRTVLEIGPGSGFNSLYTATLQPARYVLLEGNPRGVADINALFAAEDDLRRNITVICALLQDFRTDERFDIVLCEGMLALAGVPDPRALLGEVASFVRPGGVLVITCIDAISDFAEVVRRLFATLLTRPGDAMDTRVATLLPAFGPHLSTLAGMSRSHGDWIVDNLLNPASIGPYLGVADALEALEASFEYFGASPHFVTDWRWYKAIDRATGRYSARALQQYWQQAHNLLDYRTLHPPRDPADNRRLYAAAVGVRDAIRAHEETRDPSIVARILSCLREIAATAATFDERIARAIEEAAALVENPTAAGVAGAREFRAWFGRGQQYVSFERTRV